MNRLLALVASLICVSSIAHAQSTLQILDYGAEPRAPLRYKFEAGKTERVMMEMTMSMANEVDGKLVPGASLPPTRTTMLLRVTDVAADGSARLEFESQSAESPMGQVAGQANQATLDRTLAGLSMLKGWYRTDTRGRVLETGVTLPENLLPEGLPPGTLQKLMDEAMKEGEEAMQQLPDEAVGRGARWQVVQHLDIGGVKVAQGQELTLRSRSGNRVELDTKIIQPPAGAPGAPLVPGMSIQSVTTGFGTMVLDLNGLSPTMTMEVNSTTTMSMPSQGQAQPRKMVTQMKMTAGPAQY
jgi:hypothetical protein